MRVLIADDNVDAAHSLAMLLDLRGHEVRVALDGLQAVKAAREWEPDAAVLDIAMPGLDGYAVAHQLRQLRPPGPVLIALSGQLNMRQRNLALASVFDVCFSKGTEVDVLEEELEQRVATRREFPP